MNCVKRNCNVMEFVIFFLNILFLGALIGWIASKASGSSRGSGCSGGGSGCSSGDSGGSSCGGGE